MHREAAGRRDNPLFEYAAAVTPAPEPDDAPPTLAETAAWMTREALRTLSDASADPMDLSCAVRRAAGMTLAEIGAAFGVSRQAVYKRLNAMAARSRAAAAYLMIPGALDERLTPDMDAIRIAEEHSERRRRLAGRLS